MLSGIDTLQNLSQALEALRNQVNDVNGEYRGLQDKIEAQNHEQAQVLEEIARIRVDTLHQDKLLGQLSAIDREVLQLSQARQQAQEQLSTDINIAETDLQVKELKREQFAQSVYQEAQKVIELEIQIQDQLENDPSYKVLLDKARLSDATADEAEHKSEQAQQDSVSKSKAFEADSLFIYLWDRKYGTADYEAFRLTRWIDSWVAKLCHYEVNRLNFWNLTQLPKRLQQHAKSLRGDADKALDDVNQYEEVEAQKRGLPSAQNQLHSRQSRLDEFDDELEHQEQKISQLLSNDTSFQQNTDQYSHQGLSLIAEELRIKTRAELMLSSSQTPNPKDDYLVRKYHELKEHNQDLQESLESQQKLRLASIQRLDELEKLRRDFKNRRFDDVRSTFQNGGIVSTMLTQFLKGLVSSGELWRALERYQRHGDVGAWPDFGSGGLNQRRRRTKTNWHLPQGRRGGGFRLPPMGGGKSRGGFRTGGGF